jgi:hypothetical protein
MSLKNKNSDFGPKETNNSNQNLKNAIETKLNTSIFSNLKYNKYDPTPTRSLGGSRNPSLSSTPAPDSSVGAFSNAFSNAFNI